jgi:hypothetical protein
MRAQGAGQQFARGDSIGNSGRSSTNSDVHLADDGVGRVQASDSEDFDDECGAAEVKRECQRVDKRA